MAVCEIFLNRAIRFALPLIVASSAMISVADDAALKYYESELSKKSDGVYEHEGDIFIISTAKYDKRRTATRSKAADEAELGIVPYLKNWVIGRVMERDGVPTPNSKSRKVVWEFLERVCPGWMFPEWRVSVDMESIKDEAENGKYTIVMVAKKDCIQTNLLPTYKAECDDQTVMRLLLRVFSTWSSRADGRVVAYRMCGVPDLVGEKMTDETAWKEFSEVNERLSKFVKESAMAKTLLEEVDASSKPLVTTNIVTMANPQGTETITKLEITCVRKIPKMQKLFLGYGMSSNTPCARIGSGTSAIKVAFDSKVKVEDKVSALKLALCENPGDAELWNLYGRCLNDKGDKMSALICFRNSLKLNPDYEYPMVNLAKVYSDLGYKRIGVGLALMARGTAKDKWSIAESENVLFAP